jgi:beta-lactamase class A
VAHRGEVEVERVFADSLERSRARRRRAEEGRSIAKRTRRTAGIFGRIALGVVAVALAGTGLSGDAFDRVGALEVSRHTAAALTEVPAPVPISQTESVVPTRDRLREAVEYAQQRTGIVSVAVIDSERKLHGWHAERTYVSASVVKSMLLAAELERLRAGGLELDGTTRALLEGMITWSDNEAADAIYSRVGDEGLYEVAEAAGMRDFSCAGHWSAAQISARDMAGFMFRLEDVLVGPHAGFAKSLLAGIVKEQRWGIPDGAGRGWHIYFKGGWRATELGQLVHQVALLERKGTRIAIAVLTDGQPTQADGVETLRGVAGRLAGQAGA